MKNKFLSPKVTDWMGTQLLTQQKLFIQHASCKGLSSMENYIILVATVMPLTTTHRLNIQARKKEENKLLHNELK